MEQFVEERLIEMKKYFSVLFDIVNSGSVPIYFVRFEELLQQPERVMTGVYSFVLGVEEAAVTDSILG